MLIYIIYTYIPQFNKQNHDTGDLTNYFDIYIQGVSVNVLKMPF